MCSLEYAPWAGMSLLVVGEQGGFEEPAVPSVLLICTLLLCEHHVAHCYILSVNKLPNSAQCHYSQKHKFHFYILQGSHIPKI